MITYDHQHDELHGQMVARAFDNSDNLSEPRQIRAGDIITQNAGVAKTEGKKQDPLCVFGGHFDKTKRKGRSYGNVECTHMSDSTDHAMPRARPEYLAQTAFNALIHTTFVRYRSS